MKFDGKRCKTSENNSQKSENLGSFGAVVTPTEQQ